MKREEIQHKLDWLDNAQAHMDEGGRASPANVDNLITVARRGLQRALELDELINTPETDDFIKAVSLEAAHQVERWGRDHDEQKSPWNWFWTLGYLGGKCANAMLAGDAEKARHHCITIAALAFNWHRHIKGGA